MHLFSNFIDKQQKYNFSKITLCEDENGMQELMIIHVTFMQTEFFNTIKVKYTFLP